MFLNVVECIFLHNYISKPIGQEIIDGIEYIYYQCRKCGHIKTVIKNA